MGWGRMLIVEQLLAMLCMTCSVVCMHKWHIRVAQKYQGNMYVSLRTRAQIGIMEKQNQTKKGVFFKDLGCWFFRVPPAMDVILEKVTQVLIIRNCRRTMTVMM
jgi:hypothetical protein